MRSLIIVGLMFFTVFAVSIDADAKGGGGKLYYLTSPDDSLRYDVGLTTKVAIFPRGWPLVLRWGRTYDSLSEFGNCFVELHLQNGQVYRGEEFSVVVGETTFTAKCGPSWARGVYLERKFYRGKKSEK